MLGGVFAVLHTTDVFAGQVQIDDGNRNGRWISPDKIEFGGETFVDTNINDNTWRFEHNANATGPDDCDSNIRFNVNPYGANGGRNAIANIETNNGGSNIGCNQYWENERIELSGRVNRCGNNAECVTAAAEETCRGAGSPEAIEVCFANLRGEAEEAAENVEEGNEGGGADAGGEGEVVEEGSTGCDLNGNPLTWVICPIVGMLEKSIRLIDRFIMSSLEFDTVTVFETEAGYRIAWSSFRAIATAILLIAGLIMVASTALGFEFLDAYTVKKTLPKILIAALFINLSWFIMEYVIGFFNTFGFNVRELIYTPFSGPEYQGVLQGETIFTFFLGTGGALVFLGAGALLSFLATAALAVLVGFLIIIVRNLALIVIIIFAPIAIACWVLPNTSKVWNLWKDNFLGLLFVFPIISAFIAIGRVFSAVSLNSAGGTATPGSTTAGQIIGFVAYFLPYFLLPIAFRLATGVIGTVAGFVNNSNKGAFDRLKKYRGNKMAENSANLAAGTRTNNRAFNAFSSRAANVGSSPLTLGMSRKGRQAYQQKIEAAGMADAKGKGSAIMFNDEALRAGTYGSAAAAKAGMRAEVDASGNRRFSDDQIETAIAANQAAGGFGRARQAYAARQLATTGTGYSDIQDVARTIARASNGDASQAAALGGFINSETKKSSRGDLAPGAGQLIGLAQDEMRGGASVPTAARYDAARVSALRGQDPVSRLRNKTTSMQNDANAMASHARRQYQIAQTATDAQTQATAMQEFVQTMGTIEQYNDSKSYAAPENQAVVNSMYNNTEDLRQAMQQHIRPEQYPTRTLPNGRVVRAPGPPTAEGAYRKEWQQARAARPNPNDPNQQP